MAQLVINGEATKARSGQEMPVINPANEETIDTVPRGGAEDVDAAVTAARRAFDGWARTDAEERARIIREGLARVRAQQQDIADALTREQGKPSFEAMGEIHHFIHGMDFYADLASKVRGSYAPLPSTLGKSYGMVIRRPIGVVAAVVPWNFPLTLMGTKIGPALAAGNTVVVKPASTTPLATIRVIACLNEAGLPPGVLNVVTGPGRVVGEALVGHPEVRRVAFTGESGTGRRIMEIAGPQFKRVTLELGGSDAVIVCPDADVEKAVKGVLIGRFWNAGQACLASKRVYVFEEVYDQFMQRLLAGVARYEPGEGWVKAEPKDGLSDSKTETYLLRLPAEARGGFLLNVLVIGIVLALPFGGLTVLENLRPISGQLAVEPEISIFLSMTTPRDKASALAKPIRRILESAAISGKVEFIPREKALAELSGKSGFSAAVATLGSNPLPDAYLLKLAGFRSAEEAKKLETLMAQLTALAGIEHVQVDSTWVKRLAALVQVLRLALLFLAIVLGVVVIAVVFNTIRLQVLNQRDEIEICRLVGATDGFVYRPFYYAGAILGLFAGGLALSLVALGLQPMNHAVAEVAHLYDSDFRLVGLPGPETLLLLAGSATLGLLGAVMSVKRTLGRLPS
jgi:succinate-semialdehyde dehydrogenase/glutarate-semialdehyde dehydrogenase